MVALSVLAMIVTAYPLVGEDGSAPHYLQGGLEGSRALVVALHGGSWKRTAPKTLAERALRDLSSDARRTKLRLVVPIAPKEASTPDLHQDGTVPWISPVGEETVLTLIHQEVAFGRADPARIYLAGHGSGATAALMLGARHPEIFAAVAAWSGTPSPLWNEEREVIGLLEDPAEGLTHLPVYLFTSKEDEVLDRDALRLFVKGMEAREGEDLSAPFLWHQGKGGHDFGSAGPGRGLRFLRSFRKQRVP